MSLGRNLLAGLANSVWSALVGLAVVPFYLKYLGIEAYGLIGFFVTTQALLQLLDMGMAPTMNREVARCSASGNLKDAGKLLHTLAVVYWIMAGAIALLVLLLAPWIAEHWLQSRQLSPQTISNSVMLMGLVVACRWPVGLYQGALIGAQRMVVSSTINMAMVTIGNLGALTVLAYVAPTIEAFFIWQAAVGLFYAIGMRAAAWRVIGRLPRIRFDGKELRAVWRFSAGMSGIALSAAVFTQLDKLVLSKTVGLEAFGHYMLATLVVSGLQLLVSPVFNVIYPRMTMLVASGDVQKLADLYRLGTRLFALVVFPVATLLAVFAGDFVHVWTRNPELATSVAPIITLLVIGSALNAVMFFPYALQLAHGLTWIPFSINMGLMCVMVPLIVFLAQTYGAVGGAMAWLIAEVIYVILGPWITHKYVLKRLAPKWMFQDVGPPLVLSVVAGLAGYFAAQELESSWYVKLGLGLLLTLTMIGSMVWFSPKLRHFAKDLFA